MSLEHDQAERLRKLARERGVSMAHLIRDAVDRTYGTAGTDTLDARWERAMTVVGTGHSGLTDVAANHDKYLAEIYADR